MTSKKQSDMSQKNEVTCDKKCHVTKSDKWKKVINDILTSDKLQKWHVTKVTVCEKWQVKKVISDKKWQVKKVTSEKGTSDKKWQVIKSEEWLNVRLNKKWQMTIHVTLHS